MDRLIGLLKSEEWADGQSLWDRSMMYLATDFGRTKTRPSGADEFGTGHDLDNGALVVSPLANGNQARSPEGLEIGLARAPIAVVQPLAPTASTAPEDPIYLKPIEDPIYPALAVGFDLIDRGAPEWERRADGAGSDDLRVGRCNTVRRAGGECRSNNIESLGVVAGT